MTIEASLAPSALRGAGAPRSERTVAAGRPARTVGIALARAADARSAGPYMLYERNGRWSFALGAAAEVVLHRDAVRVRRGDGDWTDIPVGAEPLQQVADLVAGTHAYGWAAFELSHLLHGSGGPAVPGGEIDDAGPLLHLIVPRADARIGDDLVAFSAVDESDLDWMAAAAATADPIAHREPAEIVVDGPGAESYQEAVASAVRDINAGELQKVILSRELLVGPAIDLAASFEAGRAANTPARSFLLDLGGIRAAGFSPETIVEVDGLGGVSTQPLAGTRALEGDGTDADRRAELLTDPKEIFEHAISVYIAQDELRTVCADGSVSVTEFMAVRERGSVQHLASRVSGRLREDRNAWHAFAALFPAVTASGVPKAEACESILRHEGHRGLYSGAVLQVGADGGLDAALVLRSIYQRDGRTWLRAGAGIVGASTPAREYEETCEKLRSVSRTLVPGA
ncbi:salicylate synthase [Pseudonocardia ailaonensis]|uniref:Salicylate synthase n=1 Tax=Pseudonocardia ailaonensis TaxID=367279 RepID=A0ABN2N6E7_9PSEU